MTTQINIKRTGWSGNDRLPLVYSRRLPTHLDPQTATNLWKLRLTPAGKVQIRKFRETSEQLPGYMIGFRKPEHVGNLDRKKSKQWGWFLIPRIV